MTSSQKLVALDDFELKTMRAITTNAQSEAMKKRKASSRSSNEEESKFRFEKEHMGKQYSSLYYQRLMVLLPGLKQSAREKFGTSVPLKRVIELGAAGTDNNKEDGKGGGEKKESSAMMMMDVDDEDTLLQEQENKENKAAAALGEEVVIIGTIYKEMTKKPIILDEYIKTKAGVTKKEQVEHGLMDLEENFVDEEKDFCILEDESARVKLHGPGVKVGELVTGVSAACKGRVNNKGDFVVDSVAFAKPSSSAKSTTKVTEEDESGEPTYVCLVSGLNFGASPLNDVRAIMLSEYIEGSLGDEKQAGELAKCSCAVNWFPRKRERKNASKERKAPRRRQTAKVGPTPIRKRKRRHLRFKKRTRFSRKFAKWCPLISCPGALTRRTRRCRNNPYTVVSYQTRLDSKGRR